MGRWNTNAIIFMIPFTLILLFLGLSNWSPLDYPLVEIWYSFVTIIWAFSTSGIIMRYFVKEQGDEQISIFAPKNKNLSNRLLYLTFAYGILIGGLASVLFIDIFARQILIASYKMYSWLTITVYSFLSSGLVVYEYDRTYGKKKPQPPNMSQ